LGTNHTKNIQVLGERLGQGRILPSLFFCTITNKFFKCSVGTTQVVLELSHCPIIFNVQLQYTCRHLEYKEIGEILQRDPFTHASFFKESFASQFFRHCHVATNKITRNGLYLNLVYFLWSQDCFVCLSLPARNDLL